MKFYEESFSCHLVSCLKIGISQGRCCLEYTNHIRLRSDQLKDCGGQNNNTETTAALGLSNRSLLSPKSSMALHLIPYKRQSLMAQKTQVKCASPSILPPRILSFFLHPLSSPSYYSMLVSGMHLPQSLCICCSFLRAHFPRACVRYSTTSLRPLLQSHLFRHNSIFQVLSFFVFLALDTLLGKSKQYQTKPRPCIQTYLRLAAMFVSQSTI